jgi:predicted transcriptional regulator
VHGFGELEATIMDRLWSRDAPATVRDVLNDLRRRREIAYTTVLTVMDNLYKKGWLRREPPDGRTDRAASHVGPLQHTPVRASAHVHQKAASTQC